MTIETIQAFLLAEEMLIMNRDFADAEKFFIFAELNREFEERQLLTKLNEEDDIARNESRPSTRCALADI